MEIRYYFGKLSKFDEKKIYIQSDRIEKTIERNQIAQIKTKYNWEGKD